MGVSIVRVEAGLVQRFAVCVHLQPTMAILEALLEIETSAKTVASLHFTLVLY